MTQKELEEVGKRLDHVLEHGPEFALDWLKGAFYSHETQKIHLLSLIKDLRSLYLSTVYGPLSVSEARLLNVCRICRVPYNERRTETSPFVLNYGKEFAHENCIKQEHARKQTCKPVYVTNVSGDLL